MGFGVIRAGQPVPMYYRVIILATLLLSVTLWSAIRSLTYSSGKHFLKTM